MIERVVWKPAGAGVFRARIRDVELMCKSTLSGAFTWVKHEGAESILVDDVETVREARERAELAVARFFDARNKLRRYELRPDWNARLLERIKLVGTGAELAQLLDENILDICAGAGMFPSSGRFHFVETRRQTGLGANPRCLVILEMEGYLNEAVIPANEIVWKAIQRAFIDFSIGARYERDVFSENRVYITLFDEYFPAFASLSVLAGDIPFS